MGKLPGEVSLDSHGGLFCVFVRTCLAICRRGASLFSSQSPEGSHSGDNEKWHFHKVERKTHCFSSALCSAPLRRQLFTACTKNYPSNLVCVAEKLQCVFKRAVSKGKATVSPAPTNRIAAVYKQNPLKSLMMTQNKHLTVSSSQALLCLGMNCSFLCLLYPA